MSVRVIGTKWNHPDAVYDKKAIQASTGEIIVELIGGTKRGAVINIWHEANDGEIEAEKKLSHIYTVTPDAKHYLMDEVHFMHHENGRNEFEALTSVRAVFDIIERNS